MKLIKENQSSQYTSMFFFPKDEKHNNTMMVTHYCGNILYKNLCKNNMISIIIHINETNKAGCSLSLRTFFENDS